MAKIITIGNHYVNLDKVCDIEVYDAPDGTTVVKVDYDYANFEIPCAGSEEKVNNDLYWAIRRTMGECYRGPQSP